MTCENCELEYDPIATRWKCPHCGWKSHCCDGEMLFNIPAELALPTLYEVRRLNEQDHGE